MTDIDTDQVRYRLDRGGATYIGKDALALCNALDEAREELAFEFGMRTGWQYRAEAAEARIAAALAGLNDYVDGDPTGLIRVARALKETE